jgi:hypothetical protein
VTAPGVASGGWFDRLFGVYKLARKSFCKVRSIFSGIAETMSEQLFFSTAQ